MFRPDDIVTDDYDPVFPALVAIMVLELLICGGVFVFAFFLAPSLTCP